MSSLRVAAHVTGRCSCRVGRGDHDLLGVHAGLAAETTADERCDDTDVGRGHAERG